MQLLFDFLPILLFFVVYQAAGIYAATGAAIAAALAQIAWIKLRRRPVPRTQYVNAGLLAVLGGLTLALRDDAFIMWKPSLVNWLFAAVFLGSLWNQRSLTERMLGGEIALPAHIWRRLTGAWAAFFLLAGGLNAYVAFGYQVTAASLSPAQRQVFETLASDDREYARAVLGERLEQLPQARRAGIEALPADRRQTEYLAKVHRDRWVSFKLFGLLGLTLLFALAQGLYLVPHANRARGGTPQRGAT